MRKDEEVKIVQSDATYMVTRATELFIEFLANIAAAAARDGKRKTIQLKDIDGAIKSGIHMKLEFLVGEELVVVKVGPSSPPRKHARTRAARQVARPARAAARHSRPGRGPPRA